MKAPVLNDFPDLAQSFKRIKIVFELREKADPTTYMGCQIIEAIDKNKPAIEVIRMVKSQAQDNKLRMYDIIGEELTERILNF